MSAAPNSISRVLFSIAEFLPLMVFVYAGRFEVDIAQRFLWGAGAALVVVPTLLALRQRLNPLLVAVALWLAVEALSFLVHLPRLAAAMKQLQEASFFIAVILVGLVYLALSRRGLLTVESQDRSKVMRYSQVLLFVAVGGLVCAFVFRGDETLAATIPATALFLLQLLLSGRLRDKAPEARH